MAGVTKAIAALRAAFQVTYGSFELSMRGVLIGWGRENLNVSRPASEAVCPAGFVTSSGFSSCLTYFRHLRSPLPVHTYESTASRSHTQIGESSRTCRVSYLLATGLVCSVRTDQANPLCFE